MNAAVERHIEADEDNPPRALQNLPVDSLKAGVTAAARAPGGEHFAGEAESIFPVDDLDKLQAEEVGRDLVLSDLPAGELRDTAPEFPEMPVATIKNAGPRREPPRLVNRDYLPPFFAAAFFAPALRLASAFVFAVSLIVTEPTFPAASLPVDEASPLFVPSAESVEVRELCAWS